MSLHLAICKLLSNWRISAGMRLQHRIPEDFSLITFSTTTPNALLAAIKKAIDDKKVTTWSHNQGYFTHTPPQWINKAWLQPVVDAAVGLRFAIVHPNNGIVTSENYAVYHGRFVEMMLAHFDSEFTNATSTAMPTAFDRIKAA
jgi:hypothetical protein